MIFSDIYIYSFDLSVPFREQFLHFDLETFAETITQKTNRFNLLSPLCVLSHQTFLC